MDGTNLCAFHDYLGTCTNGGSCIVKDNKGICKLVSTLIYILLLALIFMLFNDDS